MTTPEMSDSEVLAALEAWKSQQSNTTEQVSAQDTTSSAIVSRPMGKPSLIEILAQEGLIDPQENTGQLDPTILRYVGSIVSVTLNILLVIGILGYFGIQTTSFAALIATAGVAIGAAWAGLLSNFAAGVFVIVLRPFKVGDFITAGGVTGTVKG